MVTEPGRCPAIAELPCHPGSAHCGGQPGPGGQRSLLSGRAGQVGRGPAAGPSDPARLFGRGCGTRGAHFAGGRSLRPRAPLPAWKYLVKQIIYVLERFLFVARAPATLNHNVDFKLLKTGGPLR